MMQVMARLRVEDFDRFWAVFKSKGALLRSAHGSHGSKVYRDLDDVHGVVILFEWESRERVAGFLAEPAVREAMELGGVVEPPELTYLEAHAELPS
jgi:heme-degrading monooxygenase HmoA